MSDPRPDGFEFGGVFYPFKLSDSAKDLQLIDRLTGMAVDEFFEVASDGASRGPLLLALVATSIRAANPTWSVERIMGLVNGIESVDQEIVLIEGEEQVEGDAVPPAEGGTAPPETSPPSDSPVAESSPSSTPEENSSLPTLSVIQR